MGLDRTAGPVGACLTERLNKFPLVLTFLATYFTFLTLVSLGNPQSVAEMFREHFLQAALFLAFFMLTDPSTSPNRYVDQFWFGLVAAMVAAAVARRGVARGDHRRDSLVRRPSAASRLPARRPPACPHSSA